MATTAPRRPIRPCSATSSVGRSMVVIMSRPAAGLISCRSGVRLPWRCTERPAAFTRICASRPRRALLFVRSLDARFADQRGAGVLAELVFLLELLDVVFADGRHVAERVHGVRTMRIETRQARGDVHAGKFEAMHGEAGNFLVGEPQPDRHALEAATRAHQLAGFLDIVGVEHADLHQSVEGRVHIGHAFAYQFRAGRPDGSPPAPHRCDLESARVARAGAPRARGCPVKARRSSRSAAPAAHETADERQCERHHDDGRGNGTLFEQPLFAPVILDADRAHVPEIRLHARVRAARAATR